MARPLQPSYAEHVRYHPRTLARLIAAVLAAVVALVCLPAQATLPRVNMGRAKVSASQVTAPTNQGTGVLTLDPDLQRDVETLLRQSRAPEAAAVVIDVRTGKILAWSSVDAQGRDLVSQPYGPPASLFKVVTAAALLENTKARGSTRQCYVGGHRAVHLRDLRKNGGGGAKCASFSSALGYSHNMVMAGLAVRYLDSPQLLSMATNLGLNGSVPIDVAVGSGSCRVPTSKEGMARAAAGFGRGKLTPLEAAFMMTIIARDGRRQPVQLIDYILGENGKRLAAPPPKVTSSRALTASTARQLRRMLEVTTREGTAAKAFRDAQGNRYLGNRSGGGKTGTLSRGKPRRLFSWYAGYAPNNNPEVAVAVMLANEHRWWRKGNEVARDILRAYFARQNVRGVTHPVRGRTARRQ